MSRPRVVLLRGHNANPWDLRPWELLRDEFDVSVLVTGSNRYDLEDLELPVVRVTGAARPAAARALRASSRRRLPGDRYLDLERHLRRRGHRPLGRARRLVQRPAGGS